MLYTLKQTCNFLLRNDYFQKFHTFSKNLKLRIFPAIMEKKFAEFLTFQNSFISQEKKTELM